MAKVEPTMLLLLGSVLSVGPESPLGMNPSSGEEAESFTRRSDAWAVNYEIQQRCQSSS